MTICRTRLFNFLQTELALSPAAIALALRQVGPDRLYKQALPLCQWQLRNSVARILPEGGKIGVERESQPVRLAKSVGASYESVQPRSRPGTPGLFG